MKNCTILIFTWMVFTVSIFAQSNIQQAKKQPNKSQQTTNSKTNITQPVILTKKVLPLTYQQLSKLKAVLVVGPVEEATQRYIEQSQKVAVYLRGIGVKVTEIYDTNATWKNVANAAQGAHILMYSGHGTNCGYNSDDPGGFALYHPLYHPRHYFVHAESISSYLGLHKNALVLFKSVCMGAGSSASDGTSIISVQLALDRVTDYAHPFVNIGAAGYYANNFNDAIVPFLKDLFTQKTIKQCYVNSLPHYYRIETTQKYFYNSKYEICISSEVGVGTVSKMKYVDGVRKLVEIPDSKSYGIAYVGIPNFTVLDFFK